MMDASRRGFFGFLAGAAVAPVVAKLDALPEIFTTSYVAPVTMAELTAITRKAFIPQVYVQLYSQSAMRSMFMMGEHADG